MTTAEQNWDDLYRERGRETGRAWTGKPNELLVREVGHLDPGTALDLGCGEGGDALWLAAQGWRVTGVDVSGVALARAAAAAAEAGVADLVDWQRHDLSRSFPDGEFDLVSAQFLHSQWAAEGERDGILARAAAAVAPGGVLLVVGHAGWPSFMAEPPFEHHFPTNAEVLTSLDLGDGWVVEVDEAVEREVSHGDQHGTRRDNVLRLRRG
ncbi:class I SAM-dependent methyltransferase [Saccharothrix longispora]|uniref:class I SAM-dependent methyltransferase n=1 Tax=Saccharothrix longispora TaxID=33920 RepID=UPI0028FDBDFC|nr:methyltransferase domain-containing protein [Saccharothrix longispora]MDU0290945.1 methyltransferase domain-containing protein [Saccharothrix longispora]